MAAADFEQIAFERTAGIGFDQIEIVPGRIRLQLARMMLGLGSLAAMMKYCDP